MAGFFQTVKVGPVQSSRVPGAHPVILQASGNFTINADGSATPAEISLSSETGMRNLTGKPLEIDELRFGYNLVGLLPTPSLGTMPLVEIRIAGTLATNGFVSINGLSWTDDVAAFDETFYALKLSRRVILDPGEIIAIRVRFPSISLTTRSGPAIFMAAARGIPVAEGGPAYMPWITAYPAISRTAVGVYEEESSPAVFRNDLGVPLHLDRFVGWYWSTPGANADLAWLVNAIQVGADLYRVRIVDQDGTQLIRDRTPFAIAFDSTRRYWKLGGVLPPKGFFRVTLDSDLSAPAVGIANVPTPIIGMIGYRQVR